MIRTTTGTFTLFLSTEPIIDGAIEFEVEVTAVIIKIVPGHEPSLNFNGEPASGGYAEIIRIAAHKETPDCMVQASWLLDIIPQTTLDRWAILLYESALDDPAPLNRDQAVMNKRFNMLMGDI